MSFFLIFLKDYETTYIQFKKKFYPLKKVESGKILLYLITYYFEM